MKLQKAVPVETEGAYLNRLGKKLLLFFPTGQVLEILEDYQERFSLGREQGNTEESLIAALGSPEDAAADALRESGQLSYCVRHTVRWGILLLLACGCLYLRKSYIDFWVYTGTYLFLLLGAVSLFILLHGRGRAAVENRFPSRNGRLTAAMYLPPLLLLVILEALAQYFTAAGAKRPDFLNAGQVGPLFALLLDSAWIVLALLLAWILWKTCKDSVRYYPAAVCALGAALSIWELERFIHRMDIDYIPQQQHIQLAVCLLPYGISILLALLFWGHMRRISGKAI